MLHAEVVVAKLSIGVKPRCKPFSQTSANLHIICEILHRQIKKKPHPARHLKILYANSTAISTLICAKCLTSDIRQCISPEPFLQSDMLPKKT